MEQNDASPELKAANFDENVVAVAKSRKMMARDRATTFQ